MGGFGSGDWHRWRKKATVEQSLTLGISDFRNRLNHCGSGTITWTWGSGGQSSIGYFVVHREGAPSIILHYRHGGTEDVEIPVHLQTTPTKFGRPRWWFTCPLIVSGRACNRRAGKLYLPPRARYFGCRVCHDLTYRSSQTAHKEERLPGQIDRLERWVDRLNRRNDDRRRD